MRKRSEQINVSVTPEELERFGHQADRERRTKADLAYILLMDWLREREAREAHQPAQQPAEATKLRRTRTR